MRNPHDQKRLLEMKLRLDLSTFIHRSFQTVAPAQAYQPNWHIEAMAWHLQQCFTGEVKRLLITLPPRYLKSICASVAFPAWLLGRDPSRRIICASYSADLASKHARDCRRVIAADWYRRIFPQTKVIRGQDTEVEFATTDHGFRYSTSVGGTLTGRGGNVLIIDDPLKSDDAFSEAKRSAANEWFDGTLYSRLDDKREGVIIVVMQRLHLEDLAGHLLVQGSWVHLDLPAIAEIDEQIPIGPNKIHLRRAGELLHPQRESMRELDGLRNALGNLRFSAHYQQRPVPLESEIIKWGWFRSFDSYPLPQPGDEIVQSWDTAYKAEELSDYSVCTTWLVQDNLYYLIDVLREKLVYPDLKKKVIQHARSYKPDVVLIENKGSGIALVDDLSRENAPGMPRPIAVDPESDKVTRMATQAAKIEGGRVFLPSSAGWLDQFKSELLQFPRGQHDDQVDSLSQFLNWIHKRRESFFSYDWGRKVGGGAPTCSGACAKRHLRQRSCRQKCSCACQEPGV
jgi:predicted phage terminase large subunit-like protein